jgi:alkylation response protein AidB-like acyl-CoA dehydrogenase
MSFTLDLTDGHIALKDKAHTFAREVIRPVAAEYDRAQELPWPVLQEAARQGLYQWELYAQLSMDPTGLSLPILMEELFWGCAGIGLTAHRVTPWTSNSWSGRGLTERLPRLARTRGGASRRRCSSGTVNRIATIAHPARATPRLQVHRDAVDGSAV